MAVETEPVHRAAGAECQRVARLIHNSSKGVCAGDTGQAILGTMAAMDQVGKIPLKKRR